MMRSKINLRTKYVALVSALLLCLTSFFGAGTAFGVQGGLLGAARADEALAGAGLSGQQTLIVELSGAALGDTFAASAYDDYADYAVGEGAARLTMLSGEHERFLTDLKAAGVEYTLVDEYYAAVNAVSITVDAGDTAYVRAARGVTNVSVANSYLAPETVSAPIETAYGTGIHDSTGLSVQGEGMLIAVIDDGLQVDHDAFSTMPTEVALTSADVTAAGFNVSAVYKNAKVPYAYDYVGNDGNVLNRTEHGTHVAGIIAGNNAAAVANDPTLEPFRGVAPNAQIAMMKVFPDGGSSTSDDRILAALEDCVTLGVDVVNLSLGTAIGYSYGESAVQSVYARLRAMGINVFAAAGNTSSQAATEDSKADGGYTYNLAAYPDSGTLDEPASYESTMAVASLSNSGEAYVMSAEAPGKHVYNEMRHAVEGDFTAELLDKISTLSDTTNIQMNGDGSVTLEYVLVPNGGDVDEFTPEIIAALSQNRLALIQRGHADDYGETLSFLSKIEAATVAGAIGVIMYNDGRDMGGMDCTGSSIDLVPACIIELEAGQAMAEAGTGTVTVSAEYLYGRNEISDFSSLGVTPDLKLKPDITAYGGGVYSSVTGNGYASMNGTSMASPNAAGVAALIRQSLKDTVTNRIELYARVNQIIMSTAALSVDEQNIPYSPRRQGAGIADVTAALNTDGYISVKDENGYVTDRSKLELGDDKAKSGVYEMSFTVHNLKNKTIEYSPEVIVLTDALDKDGKRVTQHSRMITDSDVTVTAAGRTLAVGESITLAALGTCEIKVTIKLSAATKSVLDAEFENGAYVEGFIRLNTTDESSSASEDIGLPYLAFYGDWAEANAFDVSIYDVAADEKNGVTPRETNINGSYVTGSTGRNSYVLGTYDYTLPEGEDDITGGEEYIALSTKSGSINSISAVNGIMRNIESTRITVLDSDGNIITRKAGEGSEKEYTQSGVGSSVTVNVNAKDLGLIENQTYTLRVDAYTGYGGSSIAAGAFEVDFTVDNTAPTISNCTHYKADGKCYIELTVSDNHYVKAVYAYYTSYGRSYLLTDTAIPVRGEKNGSTVVKFEVDESVYDTYVASGAYKVEAEDYALNVSGVATGTDGTTSGGEITPGAPTVTPDVPQTPDTPHPPETPDEDGGTETPEPPNTPTQDETESDGIIVSDNQSSGGCFKISFAEIVSVLGVITALSVVFLKRR